MLGIHYFHSLIDWEACVSSFLPSLQELSSVFSGGLWLPWGDHGREVWQRSWHEVLPPGVFKPLKEENAGLVSQGTSLVWLRLLLRLEIVSSCEGQLFQKGCYLKPRPWMLLRLSNYQSTLSECQVCLPYLVFTWDYLNVGHLLINSLTRLPSGHSPI